jgi:eukaryotic-like serine/threonine-protein kinase
MPLMPADIVQLRKLCDEAVGIPGAKREAWLAALPPEQQHVMEPLRHMLCTPANSLFDALPCLRQSTLDDGGAQDGELVGPYRLLRKIGEGGMGDVWLAEQTDGVIRRKVALKLPRLGWGAGLAARMQRECRIGALLEHPHIGRLYAAGADDKGRPYIAMSYIDGLAIDVWCQQAQLDMRQCLSLFVQVIGAVSHAHGLLIVHRDIKPGNILVDQDGQAHLLDFGIAKMLQDTADSPQLTKEATRPLSFRDASPEQLSGGPVGVASDIYSLGATLFELLVGKRAYSDEMSLAALSGRALPDPPKASSRVGDRNRRRELQGIVDAILSKAMAGEPAARYARADAFATDIERYLKGEPVVAQASTTLYRCRRFVFRHRSAIGVGAAFAVVVCGGLAWSLAQQWRVNEAAAQSRKTEAIVASLFRQAPPTMTGPGASQGETSALLLTDLFDAHAADDPLLRARLYGAVARVYVDIGVGTMATELAGKHLQAVQASAFKPDDLGKALLLMASALVENSQFEAAQAHARQAVALTRAESPLGLEARATLAGLLLPSGRHDEALALVQATQARWPLDRAAPSVGLARLMDVQSQLLEIDNRFDEAVPLWHRAVAVAVAAEGPGSPLANRIRTRMASEHLARNRSAEARGLLSQATDALQARGDPGRIQAARAQARFAALAHSMGQMSYAEATTILAHSRTTLDQLAPGLPRPVKAGMEVLEGWIAPQYGEIETARKLLERSVPIVEQATDGRIDRRLLTTYLAFLAMTLGEHDKADALMRKRLQLRVQAGDGRTPFAAHDWAYMSQNLLMMGDHAAAQAVLREAPEFVPLRSDLQAGGATYANMLQEQQVRILLARGEFSAAALAMPAPYGLQPSEDRSETTTTPFALRGEVLCATQRESEGLPFIQASLNELETAVSPHAPGLARLRAVAGLCALALGDTAQALRWARQSRAAFVQQPQVSRWYRLPLEKLEVSLRKAPAARMAAS